MKGDLDEQAQESEMETKFIEKKKKMEQMGENLVASDTHLIH